MKKETVFCYFEGGLYKVTRFIATKMGTYRAKTFSGRTIRELKNELKSAGLKPARRWTDKDFPIPWNQR